MGKDSMACSARFALLGASLLLLSAVASAKETSEKPAVSPNPKRPALGVVFASDGQPVQASIDFYRSVYKAVSGSTNWDALPLPVIRKGLSSAADDKPHLGGIPAIDRAEFRKLLPRRASKKPNAKLIPGSPIPDLQRFLDNTRSPAVIVVDCARKDAVLLRACALYYYDRVSSKVIASAVKNFVSGANDVTLWATPMVQNLEDGLGAAQKVRDQAVIEELVARNEEPDERDIKGLLAVFGKGDRGGVSSGWSQTISGGGVQLGFLNENIGAHGEWEQLSWSGSGREVTKALRTHYGLSMMFRANALDSLLWFFEMGGGKEISVFSGINSEDHLQVDGSYIHLTPGVGVELSDFLSLNLGLSWHWFFESSTTSEGLLKDVTMEDIQGPGISLRATLLL